MGRALFLYLFFYSLGPFFCMETVTRFSSSILDLCCMITIATYLALLYYAVGVRCVCMCMCIVCMCVCVCIYIFSVCVYVYIYIFSVCVCRECVCTVWAYGNGRRLRVHILLSPSHAHISSTFSNCCFPFSHFVEGLRLYFV